jgi:hypothetical protein
MRMAAFWPTRSPTGEVVKVGFGSDEGPRWALYSSAARRTVEPSFPSYGVNLRGASPRW